jgi:hypothetical protein
MLHDFQSEWLARQIIAEWIREAEKDRLARIPGPSYPRSLSERTSGPCPRAPWM